MYKNVMTKSGDEMMIDKVGDLLTFFEFEEDEDRSLEIVPVRFFNEG